ncbi:hypothetical protein [Natronobacterium gregoryi]|nr:hypothetical protein [Natronobacterium gregoryi]
MGRILGRTLPADRTERAALTGALTAPVTALGYVSVFGYGTDGLYPPGAVAVGFAITGALIAGSYAAGYLASAAGSTLAVLVLGPLWFLPPEPQLGSPTAADATTPMLAALLLAAGLVVTEYTLRNHGTIRNWLTPWTVAVGVAGGSVHALAAFWASAFVRQEPILEQFVSLEPVTMVVTLYALLGLVLVGAVPAVAFSRRRLVMPTIALGALFVWTYLSAWESLATHRETGGAAASISPAIDGLYVFLWMGPLAVVCAVTLLEYGGRAVLADAFERRFADDS